MANIVTTKNTLRIDNKFADGDTSAILLANASDSISEVKKLTNTKSILDID